MKRNTLSFFKYLLATLIILSCVSQKKKGEYKGLAKFYHNTTAKYNAYFNAREILNLTLDKLESNYKDDYSKILAVFPYEAIEDVNSEKPSLDKAIEKLATDINLHRYSRWVDDCYYLLAKAQYLKKDYETAEGSFEYLVDEYHPKKLLERSKALKQKSVKKIKKEKEETKQDAKKEAKKKAKEKQKAREKAKKNAKKNKKSPVKKGNTTAPPSVSDNYNSTSSSNKKYKPAVAAEDKPLMNVGTWLVPHRPIFWEASIWSAKNMIRRGKYYEAEYKLQELEKDPGLTDRMKADLYATKANLYLQNEQYDQAIAALKSAFQFSKKKNSKARYAYILGQLYQMNNRPVSSDEYFESVLKYHPSYDMSFHAKMNLAINSSARGESDDQVMATLLKLAKDPKNKEYEAEIYYSIGKSMYNNKKVAEAVDYLNKALRSPEIKNNIKADAYYMLANIHFDQTKFQQSKYYFDSTLTSLTKSDKRRAMVGKMIDNLKDIAQQLEVINLQDSLIRISKLSTKEKRALALEIKNRNKFNPTSITNANPDMANDRILTSIDGFRNQSQDEARPDRSKLTAGTGNNSTFFAYDIKEANRGRSTFEQYWGERPLEDNWRRKNKNSLLNAQESQNENAPELVDEKIEEDLKEILAGIPTSEEEINEAHKKIQEAMFLLGVAYRDKIEAYDRSKETLENLLTKYPQTLRQADALYYLYLNCLDLNNKSCADNYSKQLVDRFPDTYYAKLISDPDYAKSLVKKKDELEQAYEKAYTLFENQQFEESQKILQALKTKVRAENPLHGKIAMLSAFCTGKLDGKDSYMAALKDIIANYPGTPLESKAKEMLRFLRGDKEAFEVVTVSEMQAANFKSENDKVHYMMIVFFNPPAKQLDKSKIAISDYHQKYHRLESLKMVSVEINIEQGISAILIRKFDDKNAAMKYFKAAQENRAEYIPGFQEYDIYPISQNNYREVLNLRSIKEYQEFFKNNYTK